MRRRTVPFHSLNSLPPHQSLIRWAAALPQDQNMRAFFMKRLLPTIIISILLSSCTTISQSLTLTPTVFPTQTAMSESTLTPIPTTPNIIETNVLTGNKIGDVFALAIDPSSSNIVYAGTDSGGVYKSIDGGIAWNVVSVGLNDPAERHVLALEVDPAMPTTLYAGTGNGVFKTTDGGGSWYAVNTGMGYSRLVLTLAIDPITPTTIYAGTWDGVFKSIDGGNNWHAVNTGLVAEFHFDTWNLAIDPISPTTLYAVLHNGVFKSIDGGEHWLAINEGLPPSPSFNTLAIDQALPTTLYVGTDYYGIFKSKDGGKNWIESNNGLKYFNVQSIVIDPTNTSILYAGTGEGIFKSINGGEKWKEINTGLDKNHVRALELATKKTTILYASINYDVFAIQP